MPLSPEKGEKNLFERDLEVTASTSRGSKSIGRPTKIIEETLSEIHDHEGGQSLDEERTSGRSDSQE